MPNNHAWQPASWRNFTALQQPNYPDAGALAAVQAELSLLPPLVTSAEILTLKQRIADAQEGRRWRRRRAWHSVADHRGGHSGRSERRQ